MYIRFSLTNKYISLAVRQILHDKGFSNLFTGGTTNLYVTVDCDTKWVSSSYNLFPYASGDIKNISETNLLTLLPQAIDEAMVVSLPFGTSTVRINIPTNKQYRYVTVTCQGETDNISVLEKFVGSVSGHYFDDRPVNIDSISVGCVKGGTLSQVNAIIAKAKSLCNDGNSGRSTRSKSWTA